MREAALALACVGVPCVVFYLLLRHWVFAAAAFLPTVAVLAIAAILRSGGSDQSLIIALYGVLCALPLCEHMVAGISEGAKALTVVSTAGKAVVLPTGLVLTACLTGFCAAAFLRHNWQAAAMTMLLFAAGFAAAFAGSSLCAFYPFSEQSIARANAAREWRERSLEQFFPAIQPRWAVSVTGIALVLAAVAVFGIRDAPMHGTARALTYFAGLLAFIVVGFAAVAREWRMMVALALATAFSATLLSWALVRHGSFPDLFGAGTMLMLLSVPLSVIAARARQHLREGDDPASALALAIRADGVAAVALGAIVGTAGLVATAASAALSPALVFALASAFAALLLFPGLTVAMHALFPRYRTADEVFGRR